MQGLRCKLVPRARAAICDVIGPKDALFDDAANRTRNVTGIRRRKCNIGNDPKRLFLLRLRENAFDERVPFRTASAQPVETARAKDETALATTPKHHLACILGDPVR